MFSFERANQSLLKPQMLKRNKKKKHALHAVEYIYITFTEKSRMHVMLFFVVLFCLLGVFFLLVCLFLVLFFVVV